MGAQGVGRGKLGDLGRWKESDKGGESDQKRAGDCRSCCRLVRKDKKGERGERRMDRWRK